MAQAQTGIAAAMKYFGRHPGQTLAQFKEEWNALPEQDRTQISGGLQDGTETY